jgi:iron complex transport system ATP-binding protein
MTLLAVEKLTVRVGDATLVRDVSVDVPEGRWLTVVGPNGSGKTSLVEAVAGLRRSTGSVAVGGIDLRGQGERARARLVAFVPQHPVVPRGMTVSIYVGLGRTAHQGVLGALNEVGRLRVAEVLESFRLKDLAERDVSTLSGGECQRAVLARAICQDAPLVVLDEPTTGLDIAHQVDTLEALRHEVDQHHLTVLSTFHDLTLAGQYADEIALLVGGSLVLRGPARAVVRSPELGDAYGVTLRVIEVEGHDVVVPLARAPASRTVDLG